MATSVEAEVPPASTASPAPSHRLRTVVICVVVILLLAEGFTRLIASHLPAPLVWDNYETQRKVQEMDGLSAHGGADVAFLGSSLVEVGVMPLVIDHQLGHRIVTYNAALASSIPRMDAVWAEKIVVPRLHPKYLVLGLGAYDLGAEGVQRLAFLNALESSMGYKESTDTEDPIQKGNQWLGDVSALWYHKYQLRDPETVLKAIFHSPQPVDEAAQGLTALGRETDSQYLPFDNTPRLDIADWSLGTKDADAVVQLIRYASARGIKVIIIDMPVTNQFIDRMPDGAGSFRVFQNALESISQKYHATLLSFDTIRKTALFSDDIHMNHKGAYLFSEDLGVALRAYIH